MAESTNQTTRVKDRIIRHMNADHQHSLALYLRYYTKAIPTEAATARLVDINTAGMTITRITEPNGPPRPIVVPIQPTMDSLEQARERLSAMMYESLEGLGMSQYKVEMGPTLSAGGIVYAVVVWAVFGLLALPDQTLQSGASVLPFGSQRVAWFLNVYQREIRSIILGASVFIALTPMRRRLRRHCYAASWGIWIGWCVAAFFGGPFACWSFDRVVAAAEAGSKKH